MVPRVIPAVAATVLLAATASAQTPDAEAQRLFADGVAAVEREDYATALVAFRRAFDLSGRAFLLYNVGMAHRALLEYPEAIDVFRRYLDLGGPDVPHERRVEVEALVVEMEANLASILVWVEPHGARILIDGRDVGYSPLAAPIRVAPGRHVLEARLEGHHDAGREFDVMAGERPTLSLALVPRAPDEDGSPGTGEESVVETWWFWTIVGALVVGGAVTAVVLAWPDDDPAGVWWTIHGR
jgi:hypothetical protein